MIQLRKYLRLKAYSNTLREPPYISLEIGSPTIIPFYTRWEKYGSVRLSLVTNKHHWEVYRMIRKQEREALRIAIVVEAAAAKLQAMFNQYA